MQMPFAATFQTYGGLSRATTCRLCLPENGFHVASALVGSECTCVLVLEAAVKLILVYSPPVLSWS